MANREELGIIRGARAGRAEAQLALGKLYLSGSTGLPKSLPTAVHWLDRAAQQDCDEAWKLIATHIPLELAQRDASRLTPWYERAYDDGDAQAGLVLAQLVLDGDQGDALLRVKALTALDAAAQSGLPEAQWLLARQRALDSAVPMPSSAPLAAPGLPDPYHAQWLERAADSGVPEARFALIERAWDGEQWALYIERALPLAQTLADQSAPAGLSPDALRLLARCAQLLTDGRVAQTLEPARIQRFWELAAHGHERTAQLAMGLWLARMEVNGSRTNDGPGSANFKKAIRWLALAGEQGLAEAWFALSRIYSKPEFSQRNIAIAQDYLERAADMGYRDAQLECGLNAWRARREQEHNDVRASYWLQKAAGQGCPQAQAALLKIAPRGAPLDWGDAALSRDLISSHPFLAARIELAALFNLTRAEALLLDVKAADHGHCLLVDIRASYRRSKRRVVLLQTAQERQGLDRIVRLFEDIDCGPSGPEGNYRQRLYRFKTLLPGTFAERADEPAD